MENFGRVQGINNELMEAGGTLNESYAIYLDSVEASANRAQASFEAMWIDAINSDAIKFYYDAITAINQFLTRVGVLNVAIVGLSSMIMLGTQKFRAWSNAIAIDALQAIFGLRAGLKRLKADFLTLIFNKNLASASTNKYSKSLRSLNIANIKKQLTALTAGFKSHSKALILNGKVTEALSASTKGYTAAAIGAKLAVVAFKLKVIALQVAITLGLSLAITALVTVITKWIGRSERARQEQEQLIESTRRAVEAHRSNIRTLSDLSDEYDKLTRKMGENRDETKLSAEELNRYHEIADRIKEIAPEMIQGYDEQGKAILRHGVKIDDLIEKEKELLEIQRERLRISGKEIYEEERKEIKKIRKEMEARKHNIETLAQWEADGRPSQEVTLKNEEGKTIGLRLHEDFDTRGTIRDAKSRYRVLNAELAKHQNKQREVLHAYTSSIYDIEDISNEFKDRSLDPIFATFFGDADTEGDYDKAIEQVYALENALNRTKDVYDQFGSRDNIPDGALAELISMFREAGMTAREATHYIFDFGMSFQFDDATIGTIDFNKSDFDDLISSIKQVDSAYNSLNAGDRLDTDQMVELIALYDELAEYVVETGDLTLNQGEQLLNLRERELDTLREDLRVRQQQLQTTMNNARQTLANEEQKLKAIQEYYGVESEQAKQQEENIKTYRIEVQGLERDLSNATNQLKAFEMIQHDAFNVKQIEDWKNAFSDASGNVDSYEAIIEEIKEYGMISGKTKRDIVMNHPELIHLLGQEGDMRVYLNELIHKQAEIQQESYRNMMMSSETYSKNLYNTNKDLFDHIFDLYDLDLENFRTVQQLKNEMARQSARVISQAMQQMISAGASGGTGIEALKEEVRLIEGFLSGDAQVRRAYRGLLDTTDEEVLRQRLKQLKAEIALMKATNVEFPDIDFNIKLPDLNTGGMKDSFSDLDEIEVAIDRYLKFTKALEENQIAIDRNSQVLENATGADRINLLSKEIGLLSQRKDLMRLNIREHERERNELRKSVRRHVNLNDGAMGIDSFNKELKSRENAINNLIRKINASSSQSARDAMTDQKDAMEKALNEFKEDFERYIELEMTIIPNLQTDRWQLELDKFNLTLEAINANMDKYSKKIDHINDKISVMAYSREQNLDLLAKEYDYLGDISVLYQDSLLDIERQMEENQKNIGRYERHLKRLGDTRNEEYQRVSRGLSLARAEQDELYEAQRQAVVALSQAQQSIIENYMSQLELAKQKTIEALEDMRKEADRFDLHGMQHSMEEIAYELDRIDKMFMEGAEFNLSTTESRKGLRGLRNDLSDMLGRTDRMQSKMSDILNREVKTEEQRNKQREDLVNLIEEQIGYEEELLDLQKAITEEIAETELEHKKIEDALQNQIDLKEEELRQLEEQFKKEDDIRSSLQKQLELMRAMDDRRHSYITGMGEEVFTYDRAQVQGLEREIADLKRQEEREEMLNALRDEIEQMREDLATTQEIHRQQIAILQANLGFLNDILGVLRNDIAKGLGEEGLGAVYESMGDAFVEKVNEAMKPFVENFENIWEAIMSRFPMEGVGENTNLPLGTSPNVPDLGSQTKDPKTWKEYVVKQGNTLSQIAKKFNTTVDQLLKANPQITDPNLIQKGMPIQVPASFDTGGYTGDFKGGRQAILHEKELVLNKKDTENMLETVNITREIVSKINAIKSNPATENIDNSRKTDVHIAKVELPNVTDGKSFVNEMYDLFRDGMPSLG